MKKMKKVLSLTLSAFAFMICSSVCSVSATEISPANLINNSNIQNLNIENIIKSFDYGTGTNGTVIAPTNIVSNFQGTLLNIINNAVSVNVDVNENLVKNIINGDTSLFDNLTSTLFTDLSAVPAIGNTTGNTKTSEENTFSAEANEMLALVNAKRKKQGVGKLTLDDKLSAAAQYKAKDMTVSKYGFSHESSNYNNGLRGLFAKFNIQYTKCGENIAYSSARQTSQYIFNGWMDSPGHKANILDNDFTRFGYATYTASDGTTYYVQEFAK